MENSADLIRQRGRVKYSLTRQRTFCDTIVSSTSAEILRARLEKVEEAWSEYKVIDLELCKLPGTDSLEEQGKFEDKYFEVKSILVGAIRQREDPEVSVEERLNQTMGRFLDDVTDRGNRHPEVRLPKINIPPFSGEYKEWPSFYDLFVSSIHSNEHLSKVHKFQYLKGFLQNDALSLIRHIPITSNHYDEAWKKLIDRYDKKKNIITSLIKTFLDQSANSLSTSTALRKLSDVSDEVIRGLNALGNEANQRDPWLIYILLNKIDSETRHQWAQESASNTFPKIEEFIEFLNKRCDALEACNTIGSRKLPVNKLSPTIRSFHEISSQAHVCPQCHNDHKLFSCPQYKALDADNRRSIVSTLSLCFNCLQDDHPTNACRSRFSCFRCRKRHHTTLHQNNMNQLNPSQPTVINNQHCSNEDAQQSTLSSINSSNQNAQQSTFPSINYSVQNAQPSTSQSLTLNSLSSINNSVHSILPTVQIFARDNFGTLQPVRALLDSGSQASFITESCIHRLCLPRQNARILVSGLASMKAEITHGKTTVELYSRYNKLNKITATLLILNKITSSIPVNKIEMADLDYLKGVELADQNFNVPEEIDILLGADYFFNILRTGQMTGPNWAPVAQNTLFGWVIAGQCPQDKSLPSVVNHLLCCTTEVNIDKTLRQFWEIEEIQETKLMTKDERECEKHYNENYKRADDGRYVVKLPFKINPTLGKSVNAARSRLLSMERKFQTDESLKEEYIKFMNEYAQLGQMTLLTINQINTQESKSCYLPHHAVMKQSSTTTKLRVVFDGSCKTSNGLSLNDNLLVGPTLQDNLVTILLRFRTHKIALSADIEKMYRQIQVAEEHRNYQRILWRSDPSHEIQHFQLNTVTYGTASAPYLATRTLIQVANDYQHKFPKAAKLVCQDFYVDDLMTGANSLCEAYEIQKELSHLLKLGGFHLRKWVSNSKELIRSIHQNNEELFAVTISDEADSTKVLGLIWHPVNDNFSFKVNLSTDVVCTKRKILSESSRIFDPLGWLAPVIISIKILLQQLWLTKLSWDDELPDSIGKAWRIIRQQLTEIESLKIPRWLYTTPNQIIELIGFSDASEKAYAAVVYSRIINELGIIKINIITSKTRVAPIKQVSLPRLELCGAFLLCKLIKLIKRSPQFKNATTYAYTDSTIVLAWLSNHPRRWKTFVGNRTAEILDIIPRNQWNHVKSSENPADYASRGILPIELNNLSLWWHGPEWLAQNSKGWPIQHDLDTDENVNSALIEEKPTYVHVTHTTSSNNLMENLFEKFSSLSEIINIISFCFRFIYNCQSRKHKNHKTGQLSTKEIQNSTHVCIKWAQQSTFQEEITSLKKKAEIHSKSSLISLSPFLDQSEILRVGGRLQNSKCQYNTRHPIILPQKHIVTQLIVADTHKKYLHPSASLLMNILKNKYWILSCRNLVKKLTKQCIICFKQRAAFTKQMMGSLPESRIVPSRPFLKAGVDYAGPITLRSSKLRAAKTYKAYIALFVCMSTKAIHLELVSDLTSDAFIAALRRFTARRGVPSDVYSDNGTNFIGANNQLKHLCQLYTSENTKFNNRISVYLSQNGTNWHFIPPAAPHFGGIWEAGVKSVKHHLVRGIGETKLTFEEMTTLLCQIEAILNSRPLTAITHSDVSNLDALTPGHFLIGEPLIAVPEPGLTEVRISRLSQWQHIQQMTHHFWKRWSKEYIVSLQQRPKWKTMADNLKIGDLVVMKEDNLPPTKWALARIMALHPGSDQLVRVVTVKTEKGTFKRPIHRLSKLPLT